MEDFHFAIFPSLDRALERWSDRLNPVLVKETRQVLKSRGFAGAFLVMLCLTFAASLLLVAQAGSRLEYGEPGATFFAVYLGVLMLALCFVVPTALFRSVSAEFEHRTFEALAVTTLTAQRIVWGKLQGACVQMLAYYSAVAPFVCFTYLLGGVSLPGIVAALGITWLASLSVCLGGLMLGSLTRGGTGQVIGTLLLLAGGAVAYVSATAMASGIASTGFGWNDVAGTIAGFACMAYAGLFYGMLTLGIALSQFTTTIPDHHSSFAAQQRLRIARERAAARAVGSPLQKNAASPDGPGSREESVVLTEVKGDR